MPRQPRILKPDYCYHITTRCNNREFRLTRHECRQVFLYALKKASAQYLGCAENVPLSQRVAELEAKVKELQALVKK